MSPSPSPLPPPFSLPRFPLSSSSSLAGKRGRRMPLCHYMCLLFLGIGLSNGGLLVMFDAFSSGIFDSHLEKNPLSCNLPLISWPLFSPLVQLLMQPLSTIPRMFPSRHPHLVSAHHEKYSPLFILFTIFEVFFIALFGCCWVCNLTFFSQIGFKRTPPKATYFGRAPKKNLKSYFFF